MYVKYAINKLQYDDFKKYYKRFWQEDDINEKELWNKIQLLKKNYPLSKNEDVEYNINDCNISHAKNIGYIKFIYDDTIKSWFPKVYINIENNSLIKEKSTDFISISDYVEMFIFESDNMSLEENIICMIYDMTFYGWSDKEIEDKKNFIIFG